MPVSQRDHSLGCGVYFKPSDYIGLGPRILIFLVDAVVLLLLIGGLSWVWFSYFEEIGKAYVALVLLVAWHYQVVLKRSKFRTIGYRLVGVKLVTLRGKRPSLFMLTFRELLWLFGPCNFLFDLIWCGVDVDKQTMRDRFSEICLVRNSAQPAGEGEIHLAYFTAMGYALQYPHVVHPNS